MKLWPTIILLIYCGVAWWRLDLLPGNWFGDISNVHEYADQIRLGQWPWYFIQSSGPFYHYFIVPLTWIFGQNYWGYKSISAVVGGMGLVAIYLMSEQIAGKRVAIFTSLITAVSFWYVVWARVGNTHIVIPLQAAIIIYSIFRYKKSQKMRWLIPAVLSAGSGLLTYPQTFFLPLLAIGWLAALKRGKAVVVLVCLMIPMVVVWGRMIAKQRDIFAPGGFVGNKIPQVKDLQKVETYQTTFRYLVKTTLMLHFKGDEIFRTNVPYSPQLDNISGVVFLPELFIGGEKIKNI